MALTQVNTDGVKDDAVTLAKQAAGTDGQVITYDASGNPTAVGPGTDGQVLTSTGAGSPPAFETLPASNNYVHPNHSGEVTSSADGATVIADDVVDEANLKISNAGSNGQFLQKTSNTGGLTWAAPTSRILDQFYTPCDGSTIAAAGGDITVQNVTGSQNSTATFADLPGSTIAYTPPSGTTHVIYEFMMHSAGTGGNNAVNASFRFMIDGTEVTNARWAMAGNNIDQHPVFKWGINIGGTAVAATGRQSSWTSAKTLKLQYRDYNGSNKICVAHNLYTWEASVDVDIFSQPCIGITAIG